MDQINFWYNEKNRLKYFDGFSYGQFNSDADFLMLKNYAKVSASPLAIVQNWFDCFRRLICVCCLASFANCFFWCLPPFVIRSEYRWHHMESRCQEADVRQEDSPRKHTKVLETKQAKKRIMIGKANNFASRASKSYKYNTYLYITRARIEFNKVY